MDRVAQGRALHDVQIEFCWLHDCSGQKKARARRAGVIGSGSDPGRHAIRITDRYLPSDRVE